MNRGSSDSSWRPWRKSLAALATASGLLFAAEATLRLLAGPPPLPARMARVQTLEVVQVEGEWVIRRGVDGRTRRFEPAAGRPRVGVLGGSSVMQDPLQGPMNFPVWLERELPEVQVLNLGTPGASSTGLAVLAGQLECLELDALVVYSGHNDFGNLLMGGELDTSARLHLRTLTLLSGSWIHHGLRQLVREVPQGATQNTASDRLLFIRDERALRNQDQALALLRSNLRVLAESAELPVLWVPPIANLHHAPQGMLTQDPVCMEVASGMPRRRPERPELLAKELSGACGADSALEHWLLAHAALGRRDQAQALEHFQASLALDPTPLRAPVAARAVQVELAAELGHPVVDLWADEPVWPPSDFVDTLHFSESGAKKVAQRLAPELREVLGLSPPGAPRAPRR